jgi:phosphohistidine phosphatase
LLACIAAVPETVETLLIIGHNPGLETLARQLAGPGSHKGALQSMTEKFPTAALAVFAVGADTWRDLGRGTSRLVRFIRPRDL